jgi:hypothetical protein
MPVASPRVVIEVAEIRHPIPELLMVEPGRDIVDIAAILERLDDPDDRLSREDSREILTVNTSRNILANVIDEAIVLSSLPIAFWDDAISVMANHRSALTVIPC